MTTTATAKVRAARHVFVLRGLHLHTLAASDVVESDGMVSVRATGETFALGQGAFFDEKEAREVARAKMQAFRV